MYMLLVMFCVFHCLCFFFFKQKTAYEMRISDWSSDVCSSDLELHGHGHDHGEQEAHDERRHQDRIGENGAALLFRQHLVALALAKLLFRPLDAVWRRAEAAEQRVDGQRHCAQHSDLAQGIEAAEIAQHDTDDVGPAAFPIGARSEERRVGKECVSPCSSRGEPYK